MLAPRRSADSSLGDGCGVPPTVRVTGSALLRTNSGSLLAQSGPRHLIPRRDSRGPRWPCWTLVDSQRRPANPRLKCLCPPVPASFEVRLQSPRERSSPHLQCPGLSLQSCLLCHLAVWPRSLSDTGQTRTQSIPSVKAAELVGTLSVRSTLCHNPEPSQTRKPSG